MAASGPFTRRYTPRIKYTSVATIVGFITRAYAGRYAWRPRASISDAKFAMKTLVLEAIFIVTMPTYNLCCWQAGLTAALAVLT